MNGEHLTPPENALPTLSPEKKKKAQENVAEGLNLLKQQGELGQYDRATLSGVEGGFESPSPVDAPKEPVEPLKPADPSENKEDRIIPDDGTPYVPPEKAELLEP